jgi:hypothetical protein
VAHHLGPVAGRVERQLDEVLGGAVRHQPDAAGRREDVEQVAIRAQDVGDLPELRHGDRRQERLEGARRFVAARTPLGRLPLRAFDRLVQALPNVGRFHLESISMCGKH